MPDQFQLDLLRQGVQQWNDWRKNNPEVQIDLSGADLSGRELFEVNLEYANLEGANLSHAILIGARLHNAIMDVSNLSKANLTSASMVSANLYQANLSNATLSHANLREVRLNKARLNGADCTGANFTEAYLEKAKLSFAVLNAAFLDGARLDDSHCKGIQLSQAKLVSVRFRNANLEKANLRHASMAYIALDESNLAGADLSGAGLQNAHCRKTCFKGANLSYAYLKDADLAHANLVEANLSEANLCRTNLSNADLTGANLQLAILTNPRIDQTILTNAKIYGLSAWDLTSEPRDQSGLVITCQDPYGISSNPIITVDNLQLAQFIYLLLQNQNIREIIDTITSKAVLILGRFSDDRKLILDSIRKELQLQNFTPILCDFTNPVSKDVTGTVETIARLARFIIVDLTDPMSVPHELATIVPFLRTTPVVTIMLKGHRTYAMAQDLWSAYPWVLPPHMYDNAESLIASLPDMIQHTNQMIRQYTLTGKIRDSN